MLCGLADHLRRTRRDIVNCNDRSKQHSLPMLRSAGCCRSYMRVFSINSERTDTDAIDVVIDAQ